MVSLQNKMLLSVAVHVLSIFELMLIYSGENLPFLKMYLI